MFVNFIKRMAKPLATLHCNVKANAKKTTNAINTMIN